jgi:hypothetical protein
MVWGKGLCRRLGDDLEMIVMLWVLLPPTMNLKSSLMSQAQAQQQQQQEQLSLVVVVLLLLRMLPPPYSREEQDQLCKGPGVPVKWLSCSGAWLS